MIIVRKDMSIINLLAFCLKLKENRYSCPLVSFMQSICGSCPLQAERPIESIVNEKLQLYEEELKENELEIKLILQSETLENFLEYID